MSWCELDHSAPPPFMQGNLVWVPEEDLPQAKTFRKSSNFSGRSKMFPHQQMAVPMMPQLYRCPWTCAISCGLSCEWTDGGGVGCGCTRFSPIVAFQAAPEDPAKALEELRNGLELQLASVQAQERVLQERKSAAK
jgi:hypothetical protein